MNEIQLTINRHQMNIGYPKLGFVASSDPASSTITVTLQPEGTTTGPIPYGTPWGGVKNGGGGGGFGWYSPPVGGEMCLVFFQEGNKNVPIGALVLYWNDAQPPSGVALGEAILKHYSGAFIKLTNDGKVILNGHTEIDLTAPTLNITTTGDVTVNAGGSADITAATRASVTAPAITLGNGLASVDALVKLEALQIAFDQHMHSDVQPGSGASGAPTSSLGSVGTTVIQGA